MGGMTGWRVAGLAAAIVLVLGACSGDDADPEQPGEDSAAVAAPELQLPAEVPFDQPLTLEVENGSITAAEVISSEGDVLDGVVDGAAWVSADTPLPGTTYDVAGEATDEAGDVHTVSGTFVVAEGPDDRRLTLNVIRGGGDVVGVGTPIIVRFEQAVSDRAAVEAALHVASEPQVVGAWHWVNAQEVHFRPQEYWPAGAKIRTELELNGVQAGDDLWGGRNYAYDLEVGDAQIARVDAEAKTFSLIRNGEAVATWPTSLGAEDFETRNGTYIVLSKDRERNMTSCNANITCDESDPDYYDVDAEFAVRLTNSGTFVHSAPWSEQAQGEENVSHGCLNLSDANAETFYDGAQYGDIVEVVGSSREPDDLVERGDPGMVDWNQTWDEFLRNSEQGEFTTSQL
jgi:lipoprotein-anchoring transpeptidase ErfK/SrfK